MSELIRLCEAQEDDLIVMNAATYRVIEKRERIYLRRIHPRDHFQEYGKDYDYGLNSQAWVNKVGSRWTGISG